MNLISTLLFTISANLDNIPIGIFFALNNKKIKIKDLFEISFFTSIFTLFIMIIGKIICKFITLEHANKIGAYIIIFIGIHDILKELINLFKNKTNIVKNKNITYLSKSKIIIFLSINNLALGINASITGLNYISCSIFTFIFGSIFLYIGSFIGKNINYNLISNILQYSSYIIILLLGIIELI